MLVVHCWDNWDLNRSTSPDKRPMAVGLPGVLDNLSTPHLYSNYVQESYDLPMPGDPAASPFVSPQPNTLVRRERNCPRQR